MARQKGMLNLSGNLEPLAGAPLDSRDITPTVADLYVASNWPYKYIGMKTTVTATGDTYRLVNLDVTQESSWVKEGSGGSGASSLSDLEDVDLINPEEGEALIYDGEGGWTNGPAGQTYSDFTGATSQAAGAHGLVPAPTTADVDKYLKGDGSWGAISMPNFDYSNEFGAENIYDTQEKMIGQWTDGKPLYQKTISGLSITTIWNSQMFAYANVSPLVNDVDNVIDSCGLGIEPNSNKKAYISSIDIQVKTDEWQLQIVNNYVINTITLRYTKTTDSAMSIGTPNDYSTTEKIVGTWIDGKPIWQKTVYISSLPNNSNGNYAHDVSNMDKCVYASGFFIDVYEGVTTYHYPNYVTKHGIQYSISVDVDRTNIIIGTGSDRSAWSGYITIRYTKTS